MVRFDENKLFERHEIKVPYSLAGVESELTVGHIEHGDSKKTVDGESRITIYRELSIGLLKQILLQWDEYQHMEKMRKERKEAEESLKTKKERDELNKLLDDDPHGLLDE